jgi:hypothetical protein
MPIACLSRKCESTNIFGPCRALLGNSQLRGFAMRSAQRPTLVRPKVSFGIRLKSTYPLSSGRVLPPYRMLLGALVPWIGGAVLVGAFDSVEGPFSVGGLFAYGNEADPVASGLGVKVHPHVLRHACGFALANKGHETRALQACLGHRNIQHTVRYTELAPDRFKDFWRQELGWIKSSP